MTSEGNHRHRTRVGGWLLGLGLLGAAGICAGQTFRDNESIYSNQDANNETRRSDHIRLVFGHYNRDSGMGGMSEWLAQGNLQQYEQMWNRWVREMGLQDINSIPTDRITKYRANFHFLMTWNDGGSGGAYSSGDPLGYGYAMANPGYCRFDPPSGATPHEFGHAWQIDCGGFNGSDSSGAWWECTANWMLLQFLNTYPGPANVIGNPMYYPAHGRDYYDTWTIWEAAHDDPRYGAAWVNTIWTNATPDQAAHEYILDRMIRCDSSGSADRAGAFKDLWGDMVKKCVTWDYARRRWFASANRPEDGSDWDFVRRCRTPLVRVAGLPGWYRPARAHWPMEYGFNLVPLTVAPGTTVTCVFQPFCDPVRQSDWRACLVAVSENGDARYSTFWNVGTNSIALSADESRLYLAVTAVPKPMKIGSNLGSSAIAEAWQMQLTDAGLLFPYSVWFANARPREVSYARPTGVTWKTHTNSDGTVCPNIASGATVAGTAYVSSNALVLDGARILGDARVLDYAVVRDNAQVRDTAEVSGHALVQDSAQVYGHGKVRDWGWVYSDCAVFENGKVIEHGYAGDYGNIRISGSAVVKGTAFIWTTSPSSALSGCLICEGDTANGGSGDHGVHFGWNWGPDPSRFTRLADNGWQYCCLTFDNTLLSSDQNNAVFARDYYGVNHGLLMNGCRPALDSGDGARGGYVLPLDGINQYVELPPSVSDFSELTVAVWVKWTGNSADQRVWSMGDGAGKVMYLTPRDAATGNLRFVISDGATTQSLDGAAPLGTEWTHVVLAFAGTTGTLYVDGAPAAQSTGMTLAPDQLNAPLMENANYLGRGNAGDYFQGSVDEFRVYMKALAASDVLTLYQTPSPPPVTPAQDPNPPVPNAATWLVAPTAVNDGAITMSATPGTDPSGWVEYDFACAAGGGHDSGWVSFNKYADCGLAPGTVYTYTVRMRDRYGNTTAASSAASATTPVSRAGTAGFAYGPVGIADGQIAMTMLRATNASGTAEYKFDRAGKSSGWQASPTWTDVGLASGGAYTYTVTTRDGRGNTSATSAGMTARARDEAPPPLPIQPAHWVMQPYATLSNTVSMTAMDASDPSGVQYYFHCTSGGAPDSGWKDSPTYVTPFLADGDYSFQYKLRDKSAQGNESAFSVSYTAAIRPTTGYHPATFGQLTALPDDCLVTFTGYVVGVGSTSYTVRDTNSLARITVWPDTYGQGTDPNLGFKTVSVSGHLYTYTNHGGRVVTYANLVPVGTPPDGLFSPVQGRVTDLQGTPLAGAAVCFSASSNATANPVVTALTDTNGHYRQLLESGQFFVAASASNYLASVDRLLTAVAAASISNVDFALTVPRPRVVPQVTNLLFAALTDTLPSAGPLSSWPLYFPEGGSLTALGGPTVTTFGGAKWVNNRSGGDGFNFTNYAQGTSLPANGGTIITAIRPVRTGVNDPYNCAVSILLAQFEIVVRNDSGRVWVGRQAAFVDPQYDTGVNLPDGQAAVLSLVVSPDGQSALWINGTHRWSTSLTSAFTNLTAPTWWSTDVNLGKGWNGDGWSSFNGNLGDTFVYLTALSPAERQQLESDVLIRLTSPAPLGITATANVPGGLLPEGTVTVLSGADQTFAVPALPNYTLTDVVVDGVSRGAVTSFTFTHVVTNHTISASFAPITHTITASAGANGSINPAGAVTVVQGSAPTFTFTSGPGFMVDRVLVDGFDAGRSNSYTFADVRMDHTLSVTFKPLVAYSISATAGNGGSITPAGVVPVLEGWSQTFAVDPDFGSSIADVAVDGVSRGALNSYTFTNVTTDHTIAATFVSTPPAVWYRFDETTGTAAADSSGNNRNAALVGSPTWVAGKYGNAVNLSGNAQYVRGPSGLVSTLTNFTVSAWVYLRDDATWSRIFDFGTGTTVYMFLSPQGGAGKLRYAITRTGNGAEQVIDGPAVLPTGSWQHVAVTQAGATGQLYVNGVAVATNANLSLTPSSLGNTTQNYLGKSQWADPYLNGLLDDFRIYAKALSAPEMLALYQGSRTITASAGPGGSIAPTGTIQVNYGASRTFTVTPDPGFGINGLNVDGIDQGALNSYTFTNVTSDHSIQATFVAAPGPSLSISGNADSVEIAWPDTYAGRLWWSPVLGPDASWNPAGTPVHVGGLFQVTVMPTNAAAFYYLGP
jgi:hypothetical protein